MAVLRLLDNICCCYKFCIRDVVNLVAPRSDKYKRKSEVISFSFIPVARWRHSVNSVYRLQLWLVPNPLDYERSSSTGPAASEAQDQPNGARAENRSHEDLVGRDAWRPEDHHVCSPGGKRSGYLWQSDFFMMDKFPMDTFSTVSPNLNKPNKAQGPLIARFRTLHALWYRISDYTQIMLERIFDALNNLLFVNSKLDGAAAIPDES